MTRIIKTNFYDITFTIVKLHLIVPSVSEKLILFRNLITWPIFILMISNLNCMCSNNSKFCLKIFFFFFNTRKAIHWKRKDVLTWNISSRVVFTYAVQIRDHLVENWPTYYNTKWYRFSETLYISTDIEFFFQHPLLPRRRKKNLFITSFFFFFFCPVNLSLQKILLVFQTQNFCLNKYCK